MKSRVCQWVKSHTQRVKFHADIGVLLHLVSAECDFASTDTPDFAYPMSVVVILHTDIGRFLQTGIDDFAEECQWSQR